jgi:hypothetical protein
MEGSDLGPPTDDPEEIKKFFLAVMNAEDTEEFLSCLDSSTIKKFFLTAMYAEDSEEFPSCFDTSPIPADFKFSYKRKKDMPNRNKLKKDVRNRNNNNTDNEIYVSQDEEDGKDKDWDLTDEIKSKMIKRRKKVNNISIGLIESNKDEDLDPTDKGKPKRGFIIKAVESCDKSVVKCVKKHKSHNQQ